MNTSKQIGKEFRMKVNSSIIPIAIIIGVITLLYIIQTIDSYSFGGGILSYTFYGGYQQTQSNLLVRMQINTAYLMIIASCLVGIITSIKNNYKSYECLSTNQKTFAVSNSLSTITTAMILAFGLTCVELLFVIVAGSAESIPIISKSTGDTLVKIMLYLLINLGIGYIIISFITNVMTNFFKKNLRRILYSIALIFGVLIAHTLFCQLIYYINYGPSLITDGQIPAFQGLRNESLASFLRLLDGVFGYVIALALATALTHVMEIGLANYKGVKR